MIFLYASTSFAQLPCLGVNSTCATSSAATFRCVDASIFPTFQSAITAGVLLPSGSTQNLVISGTLRLTSATGAFVIPSGSEIVFADAQSGIEVATGGALTVRGSTLHANCQTVWNSILAKSGSSLIVESCDIRDGSRAISVEHGASVSVTGNSFIKNVVGITLGSTSTTGNISFTSGGSISGNSFVSGNTSAIMGIQMQNVQNNVLLSGNNFTGFASLSSLSLASGIKIENSNVTISGGTFNIMSCAPIYAVENSNVTVNGNGLTSPMISNSDYGIFLNNSTVVLNNAWFNNIAYSGVEYAIIEVSSSKSVSVSNCKFTDFKESGVRTYSDVGISLNLNQFSVTNSTFLGSSDATDCTGVELSSRVIASVPQVLNISGNTITRQKGALRGIVIEQITQPSTASTQIQNNTIGNPGGKLGFIGIDLSNSHRININNNTIGSFSATASLETIGIKLAGSNSYKINCNTLNGLGTGLSFQSICTSTNGLMANSMQNCTGEGLLLKEVSGQKAKIGVQNKRQNQWPGNTSMFEASFEFSDFDPFSTDDLLLVAASRFTINGTNTSTTEWPNPRVLNGTPDNDFWFKSSVPTIAQANPCLPTPGPSEISSSEKYTIDGLETGYKGYSATVSDSKFILYDRLSDDATLRPSGTDEANWFTGMGSTVVGQLHNVYTQFLALNASPASLSPSALLTQVNAISTTEPFDLNMQKVLRVFIQKYIEGTEGYSPQQTSDLQSVAAMCRLEGGLGVDLARNALGLKDVDYNKCDTKGEGRSSTSKNNIQNSTNITIAPNPAKDNFIVSLDKLEPDASVRLFDITGCLIGNWTMSNTLLQIPTTDYRAGMYILEVYTPTKMLSRTKLIQCKISFFIRVACFFTTKAHKVHKDVE
jgi:hypothetical protein